MCSLPQAHKLVRVFGEDQSHLPYYPRKNTKRTLSRQTHVHSSTHPLPAFAFLTHVLTLTTIPRSSPILLGSTHIMTLGPQRGHTRFRKRSRNPASGDCPGSFRRYFTNRSFPGPSLWPKGWGGDASGPEPTASQWWPPKLYGLVSPTQPLSPSRGLRRRSMRPQQRGIF